MTARQGAPRLAALERRIGRRFADRSLLETATTHASYSHENRGSGGSSYERLEFLGDAVLGMIVADRLFRGFPEGAEGDLTRRKQAQVSMPALARAARDLGLGPFLRLGHGEEAMGGRERDSLLADAFEALLGAVYLDGGITAARSFVRKHLAPAARGRGSEPEPTFDPKTDLQELTQRVMRATPTYRIVETLGPAHAREFRVEVAVGERPVAEGRGRSRKAAEKDAAARALDALRGTDA